MEFERYEVLEDDDDNDDEHIEDQTEYWTEAEYQDNILEILSKDEEEQKKTKPHFILTIFLVCWQAYFSISNVALESLLKFFIFFFQKFDIDFMKTYPSSLYLLYKSLGVKDEFLKFVVCQKCHTHYPWPEKISETKQLKCTFVEFPNHPQERFRRACGANLYKKVFFLKNYFKFFFFKKIRF